MSYIWEKKNAWTYTFPTTMLAQYELRPLVLQNTENSYVMGNWSTLQATFTFKRRSSVFIPGMYFPSAMIVITSWVTFVIAPEHFPARTNLNVVGVLTIITLQSGVSGSLPKVSYFKTIDTYVMVCVMFVSGAFAEYAFILLVRYKKLTNLRRRNEKEKEAVMKSNSKHEQMREVLSGPEGKERNVNEAGPITMFYDPITRWKDLQWGNFYLKDKWPDVMDEYSRILFPLAFGLFNAVYWATVYKDHDKLG